MMVYSKKIAAIRSDGNILPLPVMTVDKIEFSRRGLACLPKFHHRCYHQFVIVAGYSSVSVLDEILLAKRKNVFLTERRTAYMATF